MSKLYNKATSYLSDHKLEFNELFDLFCSDPINNMIDEGDPSVDGGLIYDTIINAFEHKYKAIFKVLGEEVENKELHVDDVKEQDYEGMFIKMIDDKEISPRELYMLENTTKELTSKDKYDVISKIVNYLSDIDQMATLKGEKPSYTDLKKLREKYDLDKVKAFKIESYVLLGGLRK